MGCSTDPVPSVVKKNYIVQNLSLGARTTCVIQRGDLICSGLTHGEVLNSQGASSKPIKLGVLSGLSKAAIGSAHGCAIKDERLFCWGNNENAQIGVGPKSNIEYPPTIVSPPGVKVTDVAVGARHTCAVFDGVLNCWGVNEKGQTGVGLEEDTIPRPTPVPYLPGTPTELSLGPFHTCAVVYATAYCWGYGARGQFGMDSSELSATCGGPRCRIPVKIPSFGFVKKIETAFDTTCAVTFEGAALCTGGNSFGLFSSTRGARTAPVVAQGFEKDVIKVALGVSHLCGIIRRTNGDEVWCRGLNILKQLGVSTLNTEWGPTTRVPGLEKNIIDIDAGNDHTCAQSNEDVICWGSNYHGQIGDGSAKVFSTKADYELKTPEGTEPLKMTVGLNHVCFSYDNGNGDSVTCSGLNDVGQLGDGSLDNRNFFSDVVSGSFSSNIRFFSSGLSHSCMVIGQDQVKCWGSNLVGSLGIGQIMTLPISPLPVAVQGLPSSLNVTHMDSGAGRSCLVHWDTSVPSNPVSRVFCWGDNSSGSAGQPFPTTHYVWTAAEVTGGHFGNTPDLKVSVGTNHTCAYVPGGKAECFGGNGSGQMGVGPSINFSSTRITVQAGPTQGDLSGILHLSAGVHRSCAVVELPGSLETEVRCWGVHHEGRGFDIYPVVVPHTKGVGARVVLTTRRRTCVVVKGYHSSNPNPGKGVKCWGQNHFGQIGTGGTGSVLEFDPTPQGYVRGAEWGVLGLEISEFSGCAITETGTRCFGLDSYRMFGQAEEVGSVPKPTNFGFFL